MKCSILQAVFKRRKIHFSALDLRQNNFKGFEWVMSSVHFCWEGQSPLLSSSHQMSCLCSSFAVGCAEELQADATRTVTCSRRGCNRWSKYPLQHTPRICCPSSKSRFLMCLTLPYNGKARRRDESRLCTEGAEHSPKSRKEELPVAASDNDFVYTLSPSWNPHKKQQSYCRTEAYNFRVFVGAEKHVGIKKEEKTKWNYSS